MVRTTGLRFSGSSAIASLVGAFVAATFSCVLVGTTCFGAADEEVLFTAEEAACCNSDTVLLTEEVVFAGLSQKLAAFAEVADTVSPGLGETAETAARGSPAGAAVWKQSIALASTLTESAASFPLLPIISIPPCYFFLAYLKTHDSIISGLTLVLFIRVEICKAEVPEILMIGIVPPQATGLYAPHFTKPPFLPVLAAWLKKLGWHNRSGAIPIR